MMQRKNLVDLGTGARFSDRTSMDSLDVPQGNEKAERADPTVIAAHVLKHCGVWFVFQLPLAMRPIFLAVAASGILFSAWGCKREPAEREYTDAIQSAPGEPTESRTISSHPFAFREVAGSVGLDFVYRNGEEQNETTILESLGGGIGVLDYDRDGWDDLFCSGGGFFSNPQVMGYPSELFRNSQGESFSKVGSASGISAIGDHYSHGVFVADYDNDGFPDVLVTGYGGLLLWKNQGDGTFVEVHQQSGLIDDQWSSAAAWGDLNGDGHLDLYVAHYVDWSFDNHPFCQGPSPNTRDICPPRMYQGVPDDVYLSRGDGTFERVSEQWNLRKDGSKGLGVLIADFDDDGWVDVYVANDTTNNYLYANSGSAPFEEIATLAGVAADKSGIPNGSMGVDLLDFNRNGKPDIWVTNYEREDFALYRNEGPRAFLHVSDIMGLNVLGGLFVGFGTVCVDLDHDGLEDIVVNNGHVILYPTASPRKQKPVLMHADGKRFRRVVFDDRSYFDQSHDGRGLATFDFDRDGDLDLVFSNMNASVALLKNDSPKRGQWLHVFLVGTESNRAAIGAKVTVECDGKELTRFKKGGGSYMSTSQEDLTWGIGNAKVIDRITVSWPSRKKTVLSDVVPNQRLILIEPNEPELNDE